MVLNDILFFASVLTFSAAAVLGYWQLLRAGLEELEEPVADSSEPEAMPEPVPVAI
jgi:cytochrome oxidase assembly protein ShyY1